jgi:hypothetical protein
MCIRDRTNIYHIIPLTLYSANCNTFPIFFQFISITILFGSQFICLRIASYKYLTFLIQHFLLHLLPVLFSPFTHRSFIELCRNHSELIYYFQTGIILCMNHPVGVFSLDSLELIRLAYFARVLLFIVRIIS